MKKKTVIIILIGTIFLYFFVQKQNAISKDYFLEGQLTEIEYYIQYRDSLNLDISMVDVAWHIDHSLKVVNGVCNALINSDPEIYNKNFNVTRLMSFTFGFMPRGRGKASEAVMPPDEIKTEDILLQLKTVKEKLTEIVVLESNSNFNHPVFGQLNKGQTKRFLEIHTEHHIKIIKDILK